MIFITDDVPRLRMIYSGIIQYIQESILGLRLNRLALDFHFNHLPDANTYFWRKEMQKEKRNLHVFFICSVQPFRSKIHKLQDNAVYLRKFREACVIAPVETLDFSESYQIWSELSGNREKHRGKGVYLYINRRWCSNITVRKQLCLLEADLLSVLLRPSYLPWEFPQIFVLVVYTSIPELTPK